MIIMFRYTDLIEKYNKGETYDIHNVFIKSIFDFLGVVSKVVIGIISLITTHIGFINRRLNKRCRLVACFM